MALTRRQAARLFGLEQELCAVVLDALLEGQLWLRNAQHANAMARRLADGISGVPGVRLHHPVESNGVFAALDPGLIEPLQREWSFSVWEERERVVRWMAAFDTSEDDVDAFAAAIRAAAGALTA